QFVRSSKPSFHLVGVVFAHGWFIDGDVILTSDLVRVHAIVVGGFRAETLNTIYRLGRPLVGELPDAYSMLACDLLGDDWRPVSVEELKAG
ncbi:MAG: hypothetical protein KGI43_00940, partial [Alphaproteobacteria bacterium]|nr:hypothetical protein [Alphaproteobacteria bacterium]